MTSAAATSTTAVPMTISVDATLRRPCSTVDARGDIAEPVDRAEAREDDEEHHLDEDEHPERGGEQLVD